MRDEPIDPDTRSRLVALLRAMLEGKLSFIEGAVQVDALWRPLDDVWDDDFAVFDEIESETYALPRSAQRHLWDPATLAELQPEIEQAERWADEYARAACERLLRRFSD